jgi:hypothetical protein
MPAVPAAPNVWNCSACTLENKPTATACRICDKLRTAAAGTDREKTTLQHQVAELQTAAADSDREKTTLQHQVAELQTAKTHLEKKMETQQQTADARLAAAETKLQEAKAEVTQAKLLKGELARALPIAGGGGGDAGADVVALTARNEVLLAAYETAKRQLRQSQRERSRLARRLDRHWSARADDIQLLEEIGRGSFGVVHRGLWCGTEVAVKKIASGASAAERQAAVRGSPALLLHPPSS